MPWNDWSSMAELLRTLGADAGDTRVVGGAVRDTLLGLPVSDVDLATKLLPNVVVERLRGAGIKAVPTGLAHGTVTAVIAGRPVEVTTLRRDIETDGRHATVAFTDAWGEDAARRDFTVNALYADPSSGAVIDNVGGLADIAVPRIRFIGDPLRRIAEDHLRILRFFRFHARFGRGEPDAEALGAVQARANDLMALSRERIAGELLKLLALPRPSPTVAIMIANGIFAPVAPVVTPAGQASLARLEAAEVRLGVEPDPIRRLAALLPPDPDVASAFAYRLRLSKAARLRLACLAARTAVDADTPVAALAYSHGVQCARDRLLLGDAADLLKLAALDGWERPKLPIGGGTLIARGMPAGPGVATALKAIEARWMEAGFPQGSRLDAIVAEELKG